ncbi:MAG: FHA domain-containing protein, partial [Nannocystaceae bacterium]|nr:FHA domain-containing protein [Nannocystaceae bacterium]
MTSAKDRFTATLSQLHAKEVLDSRPGLIGLRVWDAAGERTIAVQGPKITAGAHPDNSLVLRDEMISSVHFELEIGNSGATLRDLGSKNGTWIGGVARVREVWLKPGGTFTAGGCT